MNERLEGSGWGFQSWAALMMHLPLVPNRLAPLPPKAPLPPVPDLLSDPNSIKTEFAGRNPETAVAGVPGLSPFWSQSELRLWSVALGHPPPHSPNPPRSIWLVYTYFVNNTRSWNSACAVLLQRNFSHSLVCLLMGALSCSFSCSSSPPFPPPPPTDLTEIYSFHENKAPVQGSPPGKDRALN